MVVVVVVVVIENIFPGCWSFSPLLSFSYFSGNMVYLDAADH